MKKSCIAIIRILALSFAAVLLIGLVVLRQSASATTVHGPKPLMKVLALFTAHLKVMNIKTNAVEVDHALPAVSLKDQDTVHSQFR
jgi:hypothetical protein